MREHELLIDIKPAEESQLDMIENMFSPNNLSNPQYRRFEVFIETNGNKRIDSEIVIYLRKSL